MKRKAFFAAGGIALVLLVGILLRGAPSGRDDGSQAPGARAPGMRDSTTGDAAARPAAGRGSLLAAANRPPRKERLPRSLRGTDVDGGLFVDEAGHFQVTIDAIEMFEYFFSATGEESYEEIVARIVAEIHKNLPPKEAEKAMAFLERYLDYRKRARDLDGQAVDGEGLLARFDRLRALRRSVFGEELADFLFGSDEAYTRTRLEQQDIAEDQDLSEEERQARIEELSRQLLESLPEEELAARERALAPLQLAYDEEQLREQGGSPEEIHSLRVKRFGEEAAGRLAELDRSRSQWQGRLDGYRDARNIIETDRSLSQQERSSALERLLSESFSAAEARRVAALDRIASQSAPRE